MPACQWSLGGSCIGVTENACAKTSATRFCLACRLLLSAGCHEISDFISSPPLFDSSLDASQVWLHCLMCYAGYRRFQDQRRRRRACGGGLIRLPGSLHYPAIHFSRTIVQLGTTANHSRTRGHCILDCHQTHLPWPASVLRRL